MVRIEKLARVGQPVPLLAAFPFRIRVDDAPVAASARLAARSYDGRRDYSTCVDEESAGGIFTSKNDVKKDD
jgi:hypothetical protein